MWKENKLEYGEYNKNAYYTKVRLLKDNSNKSYKKRK